MTRHEKKNFEGQHVVLDEGAFIGCKGLQPRGCISMISESTSFLPRSAAGLLKIPKKNTTTRSSSCGATPSCQCSLVYVCHWAYIQF